MEKDARILLSENGWTDNKLCMEWMRDCFEPATRTYLQGKYQMLNVNGHASHVTNEFIQMYPRG